MIRNRSAETKRDKLLSKLPMTGELLRGSLLERTIRHTKDFRNASAAKATKCLF